MSGRFNGYEFTAALGEAVDDKHPRMPNFHRCHVRARAVYLIRNELYETSTLVDAPLTTSASGYAEAVRGGHRNHRLRLQTRHFSYVRTLNRLIQNQQGSLTSLSAH